MRSLGMETFLYLCVHRATAVKSHYCYGHFSTLPKLKDLVIAFIAWLLIMKHNQEGRYYIWGKKNNKASVWNNVGR